MNANVERLDLTATNNLSFFKPDLHKFPALNLARFALETGGTAPCVINAVNEVAVDAFLQDRIEFLDITRLIDKVLCKYSSRTDFKAEMLTIEEVISKDNEVRKIAIENIKKLV
jgi:1-deoxy-D-xylulose-5-phosphate reductoisomerase